LQDGFNVDLAPEGAVLQTLFEEIVGSAWQMRRSRTMETEACSGHDSYTAILNDEPLQKKLERLARHKTRIERTFHRSLREFKRIQNERNKEDQMFHSMESLIAERMAAQADITGIPACVFSERTQAGTTGTQSDTCQHGGADLHGGAGLQPTASSLRFSERTQPAAEPSSPEPGYE